MCIIWRCLSITASHIKWGKCTKITIGKFYRTYKYTGVVFLFIKPLWHFVLWGYSSRTVVRIKPHATDDFKEALQDEMFCLHRNIASCIMEYHHLILTCHLTRSTEHGAHQGLCFYLCSHFKLKNNEVCTCCFIVTWTKKITLFNLRLLMSYIYIYIWSTYSWCF